MTLVLVAGNSEFIVQVSDRRLTQISDGSVYTDEESKTFHFQTPGMNYLISYSGIARVHKQQPTIELQMELGEAVITETHDLSGHEFIYLLGEKLSNYFETGPGKYLESSSCRLSIICSGYINLAFVKEAEYDKDIWVGPVIGILSNFVTENETFDKPFSKFRVSVRKPKEQIPLEHISFMERIGQTQLINQSVVDTMVRPLLKAGITYTAVKGKMIDLLRKAANVNTSVGKQLNSAVIFRDVTKNTVGYYETEIPSPELYLLDNLVINENFESISIRTPVLMSTDQ